MAHRAAAGEHPKTIRDLRGTALIHSGDWPEGWLEIDSTELDQPGPVAPHPDPYSPLPPAGEGLGVRAPNRCRPPIRHDRAKTVIRLPAYEQVKIDPVLYAHASRLLHLETNPGNARALIQRHGGREVWINPPPIPLTTAEMDAVFDLPYARVPHPCLLYTSRCV